MPGVECSSALDERGVGVDEQAVKPEVDREVRTVARENAVARTNINEEARPLA